MKNKILITILLIGILFVGTGVFALFNGDSIFNESSSPDLVSDAPIQNQSGTDLKEIPSAENNDLVSTDIQKAYAYNNHQNLSKSYLLVDYVENNGVNELLFELRSNVPNLTSGYCQCVECGLFVPVGNVLNLIPDEYLCNCSDRNLDLNTATPMFSEENVLNFIYGDMFLVKKDPEYYIPYYKYSYNSSTVDNSSDVNSGVDILNNTNSIPDKDISTDSKVVDSSNDDSSVKNQDNKEVHIPNIHGYVHPARAWATANITYYG